LEKRKVAIIDPVGEKAGMNYYNLGLLGGLAELGVETHLFSNSRSAKESVILHPYFGLFFRNKLWQAWREITAFIRAFIKCKVMRVDYVVLHVFSTQLITFLFFLIAKLMRLRVLAIAHDVSSLAEDDNARNKHWIYNKLSYKVIVHNQRSLEEMKQVVLSDAENRIAVIKQGGYLDFIDPNITKAVAIERLGLDQSKKHVLFFGQIKQSKRLDVLIKAMAEVPDAVLIIAGKPWKADFSQYQALIDELGLSDRLVQMVRFVTDEERELLMKAADVAVFPYEEIYQSAALLMAMTYGLAAVTSDISAFKEVIADGENGRFFASGDPGSLAIVLKEVLSIENTLLKLQESALQTIQEDFSWLNIAEKYKKTFNL
jgi:D-inositol-3-phosphate glycosyltransferase